MSVHDEIDKAIAAHGQWKQKLRTAIDTGECESTPAKVKMDCNCSFGKWLHERIEPSAKDNHFYEEAVSLHAQFHQEAGSILELALNGKGDEAHDLLALGGNFSKYSAALTKTLKNWQQTL